MLMGNAEVEGFARYPRYLESRSLSSCTAGEKLLLAICQTILAFLQPLVAEKAGGLLLVFNLHLKDSSKGLKPGTEQAGTDRRTISRCQPGPTPELSCPIVMLFISPTSTARKTNSFLCPLSKSASVS